MCYVSKVKFRSSVLDIYQLTLDMRKNKLPGKHAYDELDIDHQFTF